MPNGDPRDGLFYPTLTIDSYIITFGYKGTVSKINVWFRLMSLRLVSILMRTKSIVLFAFVVTFCKCLFQIRACLISSPKCMLGMINSLKNSAT